VSAAGAMVIVNTVVIVKARFGLGEAEVAWALAAFGGGSMIAAFALPGLLNKLADRPVMVTGAAVLVIGTSIGVLIGFYILLLPLWLVIGFGYSADVRKRASADGAGDGHYLYRLRADDVCGWNG